MGELLRLADVDSVEAVRRMVVDPETLQAAGGIVDGVRVRGEAGLREYAERFGDVEAGGPLVIGRDQLDAARDRLDDADRGVLERAAERIKAFATMQREALTDIAVDIPGGAASHRVLAVDRAGCYAPGGRYPLVSSMLMTGCTARAAGVSDVTMATPRPGDALLGAAAIAGADRVLVVGGAQAIGAMAYGVDGLLDSVDVIVGPGNRYVTAAKQLVSGIVGIDMLAGPSELLVLADETADAGVIAADLLAQAEHDTDAIPVLASTSAAFVEAVEEQLVSQLETLSTAETARTALVQNGYAVVVEDVDALVAFADSFAAEHLEIHVADAESVAARVRHAGGVFTGAASAEVFGDYGAGPNHTLPTGGTARSFAGLSVYSFLRARTELRIDDHKAAHVIVEDTIALARMERLEGHARSAERRLMD